MANIEVKLRKGSATDHASFAGALAEVTVDTTNQTLHVHDGSGVAGSGERLAKYSELASAGTGTVTSVDSGTGLTGGPITTSGTLSIDTGGVGNNQLATDAVTADKISSTDTTFKVAASEVAVNDGQADVDFRVEGDTDANLLLCDAGNDRVVIGGTTPTESAKFAVLGDGSAIVASIENADTGSGLSVLVVKGPNPIIQWEDTAGTSNATFNVGVDDDVMYFDDVTGTAVRTLSMRKVGSNGVVNLANIPTSSAGLSSGDVWNNSGVLNIVP